MAVQPSVPSFETEAAGRRESTLGQLWAFLRHTKKWWLLPIIMTLLLLGVLVLLGGTAVAPFIYTIF